MDRPEIDEDGQWALKYFNSGDKDFIYFVPFFIGKTLYRVDTIDQSNKE